MHLSFVAFSLYPCLGTCLLSLEYGSFKEEPLNLGIVDIWNRKILCCQAGEHLSWVLRNVQQQPGLDPLAANNIAPPLS